MPESTVTIKRGIRIKGLYKTPNADEPLALVMDVDAVVEVEDRTYIVGTVVEGMPWASKWVGLHPLRFFSEGLTVEEASVEELPEGLVIFRRMDPAFTQVANCESGVTLRAALARKARLVSEVMLPGIELASSPVIE